MMDEELSNLQLDKIQPSSTWKTNEQLAKHTVDTQFESKPIERSLHLLRKGDDVQKLSVIQALPQLLQYDPNGTLTRIVPKIQQELPKSSCEFHIATSKIFKLLIEKQLPLNLMTAVFQGADSKDPVVSNAWMETLLAVIPILPIEQVKSSVLPLALAKSQHSSPVYCRIASCKIFGKCAIHPKMGCLDVKTTILPTVQSLCQDCFHDVRATMCSQLHLIAQGLGENLVKTSLLPSLVELAADDNVAVRSSAVAAAVLVIPFLNTETKIQTIVPLIKQLCQKGDGAADTTYSTIAKEFGKLVDALQTDLDINDCIWFLQFFKTLATKGQSVRVNKDNAEVTNDVTCREQCAFNLPAVTFFTVARISNQLEFWQLVFSSLANDSCYLVRKTTAGCVHEVAKILGANCKLIKNEMIKLLRDDAEEVLQMLVPNIGVTLELFCAHGVLSREQSGQNALEIARALLKCHVELAKGYNWRIKTDFLQQLEHLPNCMPSDFIHQHFSPVILNCVLEARPKPLRSQASRTLLVFLRYNVKEIQRKWIRDNLVTHLCYSKSCYTRHIFILLCGHAIELFSNSYFKKFFFEPLLTLADDPISNIRLCVIRLLPSLYKMLILPEDRKLQTNIDNIFSKMDIAEMDKDVKAILKIKLKEIRSFGSTPKQDYLIEQRRKEEEENIIFQGKILSNGVAIIRPTGPSPQTTKSSSAQLSKDRSSVSNNKSGPPNARSTSAPPRVNKVGSAASHTPSLGPTSDMSFLEHHFYIDAGINLPRNNPNLGFAQVVREFQQITIDEPATVSVENVDIETISETELKKLTTSTTNITDDVKVNLRKRNNKKVLSNKSTTLASKSKDFNINFRYKRYSSIFPTSDGNTSTTNVNKTMNRRSLNIGIGDFSKIPCLKKSTSHVDIKEAKGAETKPKSTEVSLKGKIKAKTRPLSEIANPKYTENDSIKVNVLSKGSNLPILKRRSQSEARK